MKNEKRRKPSRNPKRFIAFDTREEEKKKRKRKKKKKKHEIKPVKYYASRVDGMERQRTTRIEFEKRAVLRKVLARTSRTF